MKLTFIDRIGSIGTLVTALACPACWPLFAIIGSSLGLGVLAPWEGFLMNFVFPPFILISVIGTVLSFRVHKKILPLLLGTISGGLILFGFYVTWQLNLMYIGIFGLLISSVLAYLANREQGRLCQN